MNFSKKLKDIPTWEKFPDIQTQAMYVPIENTIYLNLCEDEQEFLNILKNPYLDKTKCSVFIHEMQHYYDQVSTLWGVNQLFKIYQAYDAVIRYSEFEFYKFRDLELSMKRDFFSDYFKETYKNIKEDSKSKWNFEISTGLRFSHNGKVDENLPIPFIVFSSDKGEKLSRVPLSVITLLETTAIFQELNFLISEANKLESPFKENQIQSTLKKFEGLLYDSNPDLIVYTAAVHLVSVFLQISEIPEAYKASSLFAKIALNIPSQLFSKIKQLSFKAKDNIDEKIEIWKTRSQKMLDNNERGFIFFLLVQNYVTEFGINKDCLTVENILKASGLPKEQEVLVLIIEEIINLQFKFSSSPLYQEFSDKIFYGNEFRKITGLGQQNEVTNVDVSEFAIFGSVPFFIFGGTCFEYEGLELEPIIRKLLNSEKLSIEEWYRFHTKFKERMDKFNDICGI